MSFPEFMGESDSFEEYGGHYITYNDRLNYIGVEKNGESLFFAQGEDADEYLKILHRKNGAKKLIEHLKSAGAV